MVKLQFLITFLDLDDSVEVDGMRWSQRIRVSTKDIITFVGRCVLAINQRATSQNKGGHDGERKFSIFLFLW